MFNRREFLTTSTATGLAMTLPTPALASINHPFMNNVRDYIASERFNAEPKIAKFMMDVNLALIEHHGHLFPRHRVTSVEKGTRWTKSPYSYTMEVAYDGTPPGGWDAVERELKIAVADCMADYYRKWFTEDPSVKIYVPIIADRIVVDAQTFEPVIPFSARYFSARTKRL